MKTTIYTVFLIAAAGLTACTKTSSEVKTCERIKSATVFSNSPVTVGQKLVIGTQEIGDNVFYKWSGPNNFDFQSAKDSIMEAQLANEGWYYMYVFNPDGSCSKSDSTFVDVVLQKGAAPCSITANTTEYNNQATDTYTYIKKYIDPSYSQKVLAASGSFTNLTIFFHGYWRNTEPEDGIYNTYNNPLFDQSDLGYNQVFITTTKSSIYWSSHTGQKVYVSHVGGKLQVKFCAITMSGSNGQSYTTIASGNVTEQ
jgi:hypothetical protein